jgi:hypothetical protein
MDHGTYIRSGKPSLAGTESVEHARSARRAEKAITCEDDFLARKRLPKDGQMATGSRLIRIFDRNDITPVPTLHALSVDHPWTTAAESSTDAYEALNGSSKGG